MKKSEEILARILLHPLVTALCSTLRISEIFEEESGQIIKRDSRLTAAFWHGTMLVPWYILRKKKIAAIISASKDGGLLANVLTKWNYEVIRGSSHKGGKEAFEKLIEKGTEGYSLAVTPDGPTGPPFEMKAGAVVAAKKTGMPLVLIGAAYEKKVSLNSWDRFQIPKPFSKVYLVYSKPISIDQSLERDQVSAEIKKAEKKLMDLQAKAESFCTKR